jgi:hypothetical protein
VKTEHGTVVAADKAAACGCFVVVVAEDGAGNCSFVVLAATTHRHRLACREEQQKSQN